MLFTGRAEGDLRVGNAPAIVGLPWHTVRQVHGSTVVLVPGPGPASSSSVEADGMVATAPDVALAIKVADCAPIAFASPEGVIGAAHAGWRGLVAGVVDETVRAMRALGATTIEAAVGPCIHAECYEFASDVLDRVAAQFGDGVRGVTDRGTPALDVPLAVDVALARSDVTLAWRVDACTACGSDRWYSHRARHESQRQAMVVWS